MGSCSRHCIVTLFDIVPEYYAGGAAGRAPEAGRLTFAGYRGWNTKAPETGCTGKK